MLRSNLWYTRTMIVCNDCGEKFESSDFTKDSKRKHGHSRRCKSCQAIRSREHYSKNKEKYRKWQKDYREKLTKEIDWLKEE